MLGEITVLNNQNITLFYLSPEEVSNIPLTVISPLIVLLCLERLAASCCNLCKSTPDTSVSGGSLISAVVRFSSVSDSTSFLSTLFSITSLDKFRPLTKPLFSKFPEKPHSLLILNNKI